MLCSLKLRPPAATLRALGLLLLLGLTGSGSAADLETLRRRLPTMEPGNAAEVFADPATYWYTDAEMPSAYQHDARVDGLATFHASSYDLSGGSDQKRGKGNANNEFPWANPGGTDRAAVQSLKAVLLPAYNGRTLPAVVYRERVAIEVGPLYNVSRISWRFPKGTRFVEVLYLTDEAGQPWPFTVRLRERMADYWDTFVFRPVQTRDDLLDAFDFKPTPSQPGRMVARHPRRLAFDASAKWEAVPLLRPEDVQRLLSQPFRDSTGVDWSDGVAEPTSTQRFSIVPLRYDGTIAGNDPASCANCHQHVAAHTSTFDPARNWYGFVRGDDGIFSFLPVTPESVASNGMKRPIELRPDLLRLGLVSTDAKAIGTGFYLPLKGSE